MNLSGRCVVLVDRLLTNNRKDFLRSISEIDIVYPDALQA